MVLFFFLKSLASSFFYFLYFFLAVLAFALWYMRGAAGIGKILYISSHFIPFHLAYYPLLWQATANWKQIRTMESNKNTIFCIIWRKSKCFRQNERCYNNNSSSGSTRAMHRTTDSSKAVNECVFLFSFWVWSVVLSLKVFISVFATKCHYMNTTDFRSVVPMYVCVSVYNCCCYLKFPLNALGIFLPSFEHFSYSFAVLLWSFVLLHSVTRIIYDFVCHIGPRFFEDKN